MPTKLTLSIHNQELLNRAKAELKNISEFFEKMLAIRLGPPVEINEDELLPETRKWMGAFNEFEGTDLKKGFRKHVSKKYGKAKES